VSPFAVADYLAKLNQEVHQGIKPPRGIREKSVGPNCIVAWQHKMGGLGAFQCYIGTSRVPGHIPTVSVGMDMETILDVLMAHTMGKLDDGTCVGEELRRRHKRDETLS
jgi:hypothetical protein